MQTLRLVQQHNLTIPYQLGEELGHGADGQVFEVLDDPTKVIKICGIFQLPNHDLEQEYRQRSNVMHHMICDPSPIHACVYEHVKLGEFERTFDHHPQHYILHYTVMERLAELSEDEKKVFHSILSHEDRGLIKNFPLTKLQSILQGLGMGLDFSENKVMVFLKELKMSKVRHLDLHERNVMRNADGDYRLIDFDRCVLAA